jgi:F0F1-type ATP synthase membrane subunit b/b'
VTQLANAKAKVSELLQELQDHAVTESKEKIEHAAREWAELATI